MTSASKHPTAVTTDVAARIDTVADRIATGWGHHGHTALTTMIAELYTDLAVLPTHYTPQQRSEIITEAADTTAGELATLLDDYINREADRPPVTNRRPPPRHHHHDRQPRRRAPHLVAHHRTR